jgi:hypothetical protein
MFVTVVKTFKASHITEKQPELQEGIMMVDDSSMATATCVKITDGLH